MFLSEYAFAQMQWVNAIPTAYNPSFAGSSGNLRVSTINSISPYKYTNSWQIGTHNSILVDHFIGKIHTGIAMGASYTNYNYDPYHIKTISGNLAIAPKFSRKEKFTISPSVEFGIHSYKVNNQYYDNLSQSWRQDTTFDKDHHYTMGSLRVGLMFNTKKFFLGGTFNNFLSISDNPEFFLGYMSFISGYTFKKNDESDLSLTPVIILMSPIYLANIYLSMKYKKFLAGADLYTSIMLGYESKKFRAMVIQRYPFIKNSSSRFLEGPGYSMQLSLQYKFIN